VVDPIPPDSSGPFRKICRNRRCRSDDLILETLELSRNGLDEGDRGSGRSKREIKDPEGISVGADGGVLRVVHTDAPNG